MAKYSQTGQRIERFLATRKEQDVEAQIAEAEQIVHAIGRIDSREAFGQVEKRIQKQQGGMRFLRILTRVAAILFVPLLIASAWLFYQQGRPNTTELFSTQKITNPPGVRSEIVLPDGSTVWLNAESTIRYQVPFDRRSREVALTGEAFFDVKKDSQRPFHVVSGKVNINVLGTRFNCKAFAEDAMVEVVLTEGKVRLNAAGSETGEVNLKPGERAVISKRTNQIDISSGGVEKYIGWREGKLIFDECPLPEVARQLERWFGIEVEIADPKVSGYQISTTFENEPLHQILALLELASPIKTNLIPATYEKPAQTGRKARVTIIGKN